MIIEWTKNGTGSGKSFTDYAMKPDAELLMGDVLKNEQLIDSLDFKHKYTSLILSFEEEDITNDTILKILEDFKKTTFAGLVHPPELLVFRHNDTDKPHVHICIPNYADGKQFVPKMVGVNEFLYQHWKDKINIEFGFTDPNEPSKKQLTASIKQQSLSHSEAQEQINEHIFEYVQDLLDAGAEVNRDDIIKELNSIDGVEVSRETKKSLSIKVEGINKNIRLKGGIYEQSFEISTGFEEEQRRQEETYRAEQQEREQQTFRNYQKSLELHKQRNEEIYAKYQRQHFETQQNYYQNIPNNFGVDVALSSSTLAAELSNNTRDLQQYKNSLGTTKPKIGKLESYSSETTTVKQLSNYQPLKDVFYKGHHLGKIHETKSKIVAIDFKSQKAAALNLVMKSKDKGWSKVEFSGDEEFLKHAFIYALKNGLEVNPKDEKQKKLLNKINEKFNQSTQPGTKQKSKKELGQYDGQGKNSDIGNPSQKTNDEQQQHFTEENQFQKFQDGKFRDLQKITRGIKEQSFKFGELSTTTTKNTSNWNDELIKQSQQIDDILGGSDGGSERLTHSLRLASKETLELINLKLEELEAEKKKHKRSFQGPKLEM